MAAYREHITFSSLLGAAVGGAAVAVGEFTPVQGALAGILTGLGGMLPDLDSDTGKPLREICGLTAALVPLLLMHRLLAWARGDMDKAMLLAIGLYAALRYGGASLLAAATVHRGMFHSVPAMLIAGELGFLGYMSPDLRVKALMGASIAAGFLSHLVLDEVYSVEWSGRRLRLKESAGSALKWSGTNWRANAVTYGLLFTLTYGIVVHGQTTLTLPRRAPNARGSDKSAGSDAWRQADEDDGGDAPLFR